MIVLLLALTIGVPAPSTFFVALDHFGQPIPGAALCVFQAGTTIPALSWSTPDISGRFAVVNANPVIMDSWGRGAVILDPNVSYRLVLLDRGAVGDFRSCRDSKRIVRMWLHERVVKRRR